jgi:hypothetical protein
LGARLVVVTAAVVTVVLVVAATVTGVPALDDTRVVDGASAVSLGLGPRVELA